MWCPKTGTVQTNSKVSRGHVGHVPRRHHKLGWGWESLSPGRIRSKSWEPRLWGVLSVLLLNIEAQSWAGLSRKVLRSNNQKPLPALASQMSYTNIGPPHLVVSGRDPTTTAWVLNRLQQLRVLLGPEEAKASLQQEGSAGASDASDPLQPRSGQPCQQQEQGSAGAHRLSRKSPVCP